MTSSQNQIPMRAKRAIIHLSQASQVRKKWTGPHRAVSLKVSRRKKREVKMRRNQTGLVSFYLSRSRMCAGL
jgi:hypothetical protein